MPTLVVHTNSRSAMRKGGQRFDQAVHERHHVGEIADIHQRDGEFIGRAPRHEIVFAQRGADAGAHLAQHGVAADKLDRVVDLLELVDVEAEHGDVGAVAVHARHGVVRLGSPVSGLDSATALRPAGAPGCASRPRQSAAPRRTAAW
jgi:hypothetical protein